MTTVANPNPLIQNDNEAQPQTEGKSMFEEYFKMGDGIISTNVKTMTFYSSTAITLFLIAIFCNSCYQG